MPIHALNPCKRSLARGTVLVLGSLLLAFLMAFPNDNASLKLLIPVALAFFGTFDTIRCLRMRWSFYHGGVLLLLYADVLVLALLFFFLLFPYVRSQLL
jgi:hypothetical protein